MLVSFLSTTQQERYGRYPDVLSSEEVAATSTWTMTIASGSPPSAATAPAWATHRN